MGCYQSKIEDEESVLRCRKQKRFVKQAIRSRAAFAASHAGYLQALHATATAFQKLAETEFREQIIDPPAGQHPPPSSPSPPSHLILSPPNQQTPDPPSHDHCPPNHPLPRSTSLPAMALKTTPLQAETVLMAMSPARTSNLYQLDQEYHHQLHDAPPLYMYRTSMDQTSLFSFPSNHHHAIVLSPPLHHSPHASTSEWVDWLQLFEPPTMAVHLQQERRYKLEEQGEAQYMELAMEIHDQQHSSKTAEKEEDQNNEKEGGQKLRKETVQILEQVPDDHTQAAMAEGDIILKRILDESVAELKLEEQKEEEEVQLPEQKVALEFDPSCVKKVASSEIKGEAEAMSTKETMEIGEVLQKIKEEFVKASKSGSHVSKILEASSKLHHHSNFFDSKGLSDHSSRLLRGLSWGSWSPRTPLSSSRGIEGSEAGDICSTSTTLDHEEEADPEIRSHASTLDRIYAWEKKLYQQVKAVELINKQFEKKRKLLLNLDSKGDNFDKIDKTRALIKALETQMMVAFQAMEATSMSIKKITDEEMHFQLLQLLEGLMKMWNTMYDCHVEQRTSVSRMRTPPPLPDDDDHHHHHHHHASLTHASMDLHAALNHWHSILTSAIASQKDYIHNLSAWLQLGWIIPERESKRAAAAAAAARRVSPLFVLCRNWEAALGKVAEKPVADAIKRMAGIMAQIIAQQNEEQRICKNVEALAGDLRRQHLMATIQPKFRQKGGGVPAEVSVSEREEVLEELKRRVEEEKERLGRATGRTRAVTVEGLERGLPGVFQALSEFAATCSKAYQALLTEVRVRAQESKTD